MKHTNFFSAFFPTASVAVLLVNMLVPISSVQAAYRFVNFRAHPPVHIYGQAATAPKGMTPDMMKFVYRLPSSGGKGTIAIIGAYDDKTIEKDLAVFDQQFGLPECTAANGCFEKHFVGKGGRKIKSDFGWSLETSLDVEWAHAIAPQAKILLVSAATPSGVNLMKAIDYARKRADVVAVTMSWGGPEFADETKFDSHFTAGHDVTFFASSGDNGAGVSWPAVSPNVVAVGGTTLTLGTTGAFLSETAWSGSGGGVSAFETEPEYQKNYVIPKAGGKRAVPDVAYDADPASGFAVYRSTSAAGSTAANLQKGWYTLGGTSAGAPQWAAIKALGNSADNQKFYVDKAMARSMDFFRDIKSGNNGACAYYCDARKRYDYVTGLGSPLTVKF